MSDSEMAISATRRQIRELADGTLEVKLHVDPRFKEAFHRLFPDIDVPVALAPLNADFEGKTFDDTWKEAKTTAEEKLKGGPLAKSAGQMCEYVPFQAFFRYTQSSQWLYFSILKSSEVAAKILRSICNIKSRAELDHNPEAAKRFHELMDEYRKWNHEAKVNMEKSI